MTNKLRTVTFDEDLRTHFALIFWASNEIMQSQVQKNIKSFSSDTLPSPANAMAFD